jgi:hypothetical protein
VRYSPDRLLSETGCRLGGDVTLHRLPDRQQAQHGDIKIGRGPTIAGLQPPGSCGPDRKVARQKKIPLQHEAMSATSGTDTAPSSGLVGIPSA